MRILILLLTLFISPAVAEDGVANFYAKVINDAWTVYGVTNPLPRHNGCFAETVYKNGSKVQLTKDLVDDTLFFWIQDTKWNLEGEYGTENVVQVNLYDANNKFINGFPITFIFQNKNTIWSKPIRDKTFVYALYKAFKVDFIMPGDIENANIFPRNGKAMVDALVACMKVAPAAALAKPKGETL